MNPSKWKREQIKKYVTKWRGRLFLGEWHIDVVYMKKEASDGAYAECQSSATYLEADIVIYPRFWTQPQPRWEHTIVHELAHCHSSRLARMLDDALNGKLHAGPECNFQIEQLTQRIANIAYQMEWKK